MPWYRKSVPTLLGIAAPDPVEPLTLPNESYLIDAVDAPLASAIR
jgi:hypothetical protein